MNTIEMNLIIQKKAGHNALYQQMQSVLGRIEEKLLSACHAESTMRADLIRVIMAGGKRLRPMLALIGYRMGGKQVLEIEPLMYMLELMHTASLVHDDVVDSAELRRGKPTINSTSGISAAVQSGDFLLAKAMEQLHIYRGTGINEMLADVSAQMCLGELQQQKIHLSAGIQTKEAYFVQIYRKTASLMAASCYTGALAGGMNEQKANMLYAYGEKLGMAFQLQDDLLDYSANPVFGKSAGQDLRSGLYTLPVFHLLEQGVPASVHQLLEKRSKSDDEVSRLIHFIRQTDALEYTENAVRQKSNEAVEALCGFPQSQEKKALVKLAEALSERRV